MFYQRIMRRRLATALEWSAVDKGLVIMAMSIPLYLQYMLWGMYVLSRDDRERLVNVQVAVETLQLHALLIASGSAIALAGVLIRKRWPDLLLFQHVTIQFFALSLVAASYGIGTVSFCAGIVLLGAPIFGFILLDRLAVWLASGAALIALVALSYATTYGYLPYAPVVVPPIDHASRLFWMNSLFFFAAPFLIFITLMADQMLTWWREREERIRLLSRTDALTGLHNRRSIMEALDQEIGRSARHGTVLSVVILDLDHFKRINDTWGHPAGDQVLRESARVLRESVRETDLVGRYGGEEFMVILPGASLREAEGVLERCRQKLAETQIVTETNELLRVSASFGLVCDETGGDLAAQILIKGADEALYRAKENGRNRIESSLMSAAAQRAM